MCAVVVDPPVDQACGWYIWSVPGAPVRVHLHFNVMQQIWRYVEQPPGLSYRSVTQRSGLLLGKVDANGGSEISGFQPLSTLQAADMEAAIINLESSGSEVRVIGFFRTHDEELLCLAPADVSLAKAFFSHPKCIFLLIHPLNSGPANAGFFFWDGGQLNADFCFLEFPFEATALPPLRTTEKKTESPTPSNPQHPVTSSAARVCPRRRDETNPVQFSPEGLPLKPYEPSTESDLVSLRERAVSELGSGLPLSSTTVKQAKPGKLLWLLSTAFLGCMAILSSALLYWSARSHAGRPVAAPVPRTALRSSPLGLRVEGRGDRLLVSWDLRVSAVKSATGGRLEIIDGSLHKDIRLDPSQTVDGSVLYSAVSDDVTFRLEVQDKGGSVTESVRVLEGLRHELLIATPKVDSPAVDVKAHARQSTERPNANTGAELGQDASKVIAPQNSTAASVVKWAIASDTHLASFQPATPPAIDVIKPQIPILLTPTTITTEAPPREVIKNIPSTSPVEPATGSGATVGKKITIPEKPGVTDSYNLNAPAPDYSPPRPLKEVTPDLRAYSPSIIEGTPEIVIQASIDASGRVKEARPMIFGVKPNGLVAAAAITAAKQWVFEPARLHGKTIPSEHRILFSFRHLDQ